MNNTTTALFFVSEEQGGFVMVWLYTIRKTQKVSADDERRLWRVCIIDFDIVNRQQL